MWFFCGLAVALRRRMSLHIHVIQKMGDSATLTRK